MRKNLVATALLTLFMTATAAYAAPELTVDRGSYNFGSVAQGKKVQHAFTIKNTGDAPLQIKQLSAACGCTAAKPSTSLILPGKTAEIDVTFDSSNFSGKVEKTVTMTTNAGKTPNYTFSMEGTVTEELQVSPRQVSLGPLTAGAPKQVTISVTNKGGNTVKLVSVSANSNTLQIKPTIKKNELKPGETGVIELTVTAKPDAKVLSGYIHIATSSAQKKEITVPIYASVVK